MKCTRNRTRVQGHFAPCFRSKVHLVSSNKTGKLTFRLKQQDVLEADVPDIYTADQVIQFESSKAT